MMIEALGVVFIGMIIVSVLFYRLVHIKRQHIHMKNVQGLVRKISLERNKRERRLWHLNLYDFLKYNLKEALGNSGGYEN